MNKGTGAGVPLYVEITDEPIEPGRNYIDKQTGQSRPIPGSQPAYLWDGARFPKPFKIDVPDAGPYRPGLYLLAGDVFSPGEYGRLSFKGRSLFLLPVEEALAALLPGQRPKAVA